MRTFVRFMSSFVAALAFSLMTITASAQEVDWKGLQGMQRLTVDADLMTMSATYFYNSGTGTSTLLGYLGPKFPISDWGFISPQVGVVGNKAGHDYTIAALRAGVNVGSVSFFGLLDVYFWPKLPVTTLYFFNADYNRLDESGKGWHAGAHLEGLDKQLSWGPHFGYSIRTAGCDETVVFWNGEVQYHGAVEKDNVYGHFVRLVSAIKFGRVSCKK